MFWRVGRDPVADDGGADDVGDELVLAAVPGEETWAGAAAAVEFFDLGDAFGGELSSS